MIQVMDERHSFVLTGSMRIQLDRANIDATTLVVYNNTRSRVYFDYTVYQIGGMTEINVILGGDIANDGDQTLSFDYNSITEPQREEASMVHSFRVRERFGFGLSTYYEYQNRDESVDSMDTTIVPDEFAIHVFGMDYTHKGLRVLAEYKDEASTRIPYNAKRLEANYVVRLDADTRVTVYGSSSWIHYVAEPLYEVHWLTVGGEASTRLMETLRVTGRLDYRNEDDSRQGDTRGFQWDLEFVYHYRQFSAHLGAEFDTLDRFDHSQDSNRVYLRMKRMF